MQPFPASRRITTFAKDVIAPLRQPEKMVLLSLGCEEPGQSVLYDCFQANLMEDQPQPTLSRRLFDQSLRDILCNGGGITRLNSEHLPVEFRDAGMLDDYGWHVLPLSVFATPIGFLLISDQEELPSQAYGHLNGHLLDALMSELDEYFSEEVLRSIEHPKALAQEFNRAVLPWLAPYSHCLSDEAEAGNVETYFDLWNTIQFTTRLSLSVGAKAFWMEYTFCNSIPDVAQLPFGLSFLERYFNQILCVRWERLRVQIPDRRELEAKLDHVTNLLEDIRQDVLNIPYMAGENGGDEIVKPFTFYLPVGKKDWIICFNGLRENMMDKPQRNVGLECIRILLQNPDRTFSPPELYTKNRYTKGQRQSPETDTIENERRKYELLDYLDSFKEALETTGNPKEIREIWRFRLEVLKVLLMHEPQNPKFKFQYGEAAEKIKHYQAAMADENLDPKKIKLFNDLKPTGNYHNTSTTLQHGIKDAIALLDNPELQAYLTATIVQIKRGEHEPFKYVPGLSNHPAVKRLPVWDTGDPIA
ncbi:MAG: hypothetical protein IT262_06660 [Saprospiraceae bacterium]|nr:hypothetical protein [Saprospiraceae bacterium]